MSMGRWNTTRATPLWGTRPSRRVRRIVGSAVAALGLIASVGLAGASPAASAGFGALTISPRGVPSPPGGGGAAPSVSAPAAPSSVVATAGDSQAAVTWTGGSGSTAPTGWEIQHSANFGEIGETWTTSTTIPSPLPVSPTSATVTGLTNGTPYVFRVRATSGSGSSAYASSNSVIPVAPASVPAPPTNFTLKYDGNGGVCTVSQETFTGFTWVAVPGHTQAADGSVTSRTCSRPGYVWEGWNTSVDETGNGFLPGGSTYMSGDNMLHAVWRPVSTTVATVATHLVSFDASKGTCTLPAPASYPAGERVALPGYIGPGSKDDACHLRGHDWIGWAVSKDGRVAFPAGGTGTVVADTTYYPVYTKVRSSCRNLSSGVKRVFTRRSCPAGWVTR